ncbi:transmembrane protein, putative (macronuclear) [Tetrahymena thermophila SB210]|uniref:Transmembrane protein, putative n=1 Tax=Tetrahymena thermophila (strain SB210) TaxID=312017 RepID=W7X9B7_TETTS|nr:transmembrane protein, putative [Tetrahymena thermophila SB210]EWS75990.1 transmembrane protein, putative [Tetrahymena thermophila SB210]|eukprot:XP_012651508.1 transmembrane protein, putative [Tetrahymena thermophila SB210]
MQEIQLYLIWSNPVLPSDMLHQINNSFLIDNEINLSIFSFLRISKLLCIFCKDFSQIVLGQFQIQQKSFLKLINSMLNYHLIPCYFGLHFHFHQNFNQQRLTSFPRNINCFELEKQIQSEQLELFYGTTVFIQHIKASVLHISAGQLNDKFDHFLFQVSFKFLFQYLINLLLSHFQLSNLKLLTTNHLVIYHPQNLFDLSQFYFYCCLLNCLFFYYLCYFQLLQILNGKYFFCLMQILQYFAVYLNFSALCYSCQKQLARIYVIKVKFMFLCLNLSQSNQLMMLLTFSVKANNYLSFIQQKKTLLYQLIHRIH